MSDLPTNTASGYITVVQEQRFRLMTDDGQGLLLTLARDADVDAAELRRFHEAHTHVLVTYGGTPNLETGAAHAVRAA